MSETSLQNSFLSTLRDQGAAVAIYLVSGIKLQGKIVSFDEQVVFLKNSMTQMVQKHAISTIVPEQQVDFARG